MDEFSTVALTGGPCGGKSTVLNALKEEFGERLVLVPEVATIVLESWFPLPGRDLEWSQEWQDAFQSIVSPLQIGFETGHALAAKKRGVAVMVCDRGLLDGVAYTGGDVAGFCARYGIGEDEAYDRYQSVIHLESLATSDPEQYGKVGNDIRYESLVRAQELEYAIRAAWKGHPNRVIIDSGRGIEGKISDVTLIIRQLLGE